MADKIGSFRVGIVGAAVMLGAQWLCFLSGLDVPIAITYVLYFMALGFRNVSHTALATRVPRPFERARFQSFQSSVQSLASAAGAWTSAGILTQVHVQGPDGLQREALAGMEGVAVLSMALTVLVPVVMVLVERGVKRSECRSMDSWTTIRVRP